MYPSKNLSRNRHWRVDLGARVLPPNPPSRAVGRTYIRTPLLSTAWKHPITCRRVKIVHLRLVHSDRNYGNSFRTSRNQQRNLTNKSDETLLRVIISRYIYIYIGRGVSAKLSTPFRFDRTKTRFRFIARVIRPRARGSFARLSRGF